MSAQADAIASDPDLRRVFPYHVLEPASDWTGMGLLTSWPLVGSATRSTSPPMIATSVRSADGVELDVIVAHAPPPTVGILRSGSRYDPSRRDAALQAIRHRMDISREAGRPLVLLGDLNLTDREVAYSDLVEGLTDAHRATGVGWGHTWRPPVVDWLPFGLLRIDLVITGGGIRPISSAPDCTPRGSDHCILDVAVVLEAAGTP